MTDNTSGKEVFKLDEQKGGQNLLATMPNFSISLPESVEIKMVNASVLSEYETWTLITSMLASAVVGFLVAFVLDTTNHAVGYMTLVWGLLFIVSGVTALRKRRLLGQKSKIIRYTVTGLVKNEQ